MNIPSQLISKVINYFEVDAPCSYKSTTQALGFIFGLSRFSKVAEIGCGRGLKTLLLHERSQAQIYAIDECKEYTDYTSERVKSNNLYYNIEVIQADYSDLPLRKRHLDMVWSERAAVEVGYRKALDSWSQFVIIGGYICLCAYCWTKPNPQVAISDFWKRNKTDIDTIENRMKDLNRAGFLTTSYFILPESDWWEYYSPFDVNSEEMLKDYPDDNELATFNKTMKHNIDMFEKYGDEYCYALFIGQKYK